MIHSKAIDVLKTFSKEELKQFSDFVRSPFHNKNKNLIKLFDVLEKYHPEFEVENEKVYSDVSPGKDYNHNNLKKLMSEMFEVLEKYLIQIRFEKENLLKKVFLLQECDYHYLDNIFLNNYGKFKKEFSDFQAMFYEKSLFETTVFQFYLYREKLNLAINNIFKKSDYNVCYFIFQFLYGLQDIQNIRKNHNLTNEISALELFSENIKLDNFIRELYRNKTENNFLLLVCNLTMLLIEPDKEEYFDNAKEILMKFPVVKEAYYENFYQYLTFLENYCKRKSDNGVYKFQYEYFDLIKLGLSIRNPDDMYYHSIDTKEYSNIIKASLFANEIKWMEQFIIRCSDDKHVDQPENIYNYGMAFLKYAEKDYEESLRYISMVEFTDLVKKVDMKILTLRCYYELNFFDSAISIIDSLRHFVIKSGFSESFKKKHKAHLLVFSKLLQIKQNPEKTNDELFKKLKSDIECFSCFTKKWLLDKINELEKLILKKSKTKKQKHLKTA